MKVLFDHQIFDSQKVGGISRYFYELFSEFEKDEHITWELPIRYSNNEYLKNSEFINSLSSKVNAPNYLDFLPALKFPGKGLLFRQKNKFFPPLSELQAKENKSLSIEKIKKGDFDVFHPTYYDNYFLDYIGDKPFVLTVYDLIHQIYPEYFPGTVVDRSKETLNRASRIIAISESTKRDLVSFFGIDENKIIVTYLANSIDVAAANSEPLFDKPELPKRYLLFVGNRERYKNFLSFIQAYAMLKAEDKDLFVVCTGAAFTKEEAYLFEQLGIRDTIMQLYVDDARLAYLYKHAQAFAFPSLYEGFGLPVLEAFSCGCPVIVSNSSSLTEVGGDAVMYFNAKDIASIKSAIKSVLDGTLLRESLIKKGFQVLSNFSWHKTAIETKNVYGQVLAEYNN